MDKKSCKVAVIISNLILNANKKTAKLHQY
jgi:hypothetical protein